jgi:chromosome segregation ATPase
MLEKVLSKLQESFSMLSKDYKATLTEYDSTKQELSDMKLQNVKLQSEVETMKQECHSQHLRLIQEETMKFNLTTQLSVLEKSCAANEDAQKNYGEKLATLQRCYESEKATIDSLALALHQSEDKLSETIKALLLSSKYIEELRAQRSDYRINFDFISIFIII